MNPNKKYSQRFKKQNRINKKLFVKLGVVLLAIAAIFSLLELTNTINVFGSAAEDKDYSTRPASDNRTISDKNKGEPDGDNNTSGNSSANYGEDKEPSPAPTDSNTPLTAPTGTFVSNHRPNLSGSPAPNQVQSTCTTTPGATCQIIFTNGAQTKSLPAQTTDKGGSSYWSWTLQDIGLTEGSWEVTAKAVLGSQTKTTVDSLKMEVKQ